MTFCIGEVMSSEVAHTICTLLASASFENGALTAGWHAKTVKQNQQLSKQTPLYEQLEKQVRSALDVHELFQLAARPKIIRRLLFSRYESGMFYGTHVDDAIMRHDTGRMRSDLSFTLFLSEPEGYDGGELVRESHEGEKKYKLPAGALLLYPSGDLHRVEPVTRGTRYVVVGWVQSLVRDPRQREILFDLDRLRRQLYAADGKSEIFDTLSKSVSNLLRMWAEV